MKITYDPVKRAVTLAERGIDFEDAAEVFSGDTMDYPDDRRDYGELRMLTVGHLRGRMVIVVWTLRGSAARHFDEKSELPAKKRVLGSDLKKVDRHVVQPHEYDEIPELTEEWFASADRRRGGKLVRRGRPKSDDPKQLVSLRLDADVLRWFKRTGAGYQSRIGDVLRRHVQSAERRKKTG
jgi:uncharacterized protein (DUF4415 family)/uncharacterized DUF497 family protein